MKESGNNVFFNREVFDFNRLSVCIFEITYRVISVILHYWTFFKTPAQRRIERVHSNHGRPCVNKDEGL